MPFLTYLSFNIFTATSSSVSKLFICDFYGFVTFALLRYLMDPSGSGQNPTLFVVCSPLLEKKDKWASDPIAKVSCFSQWCPPLCLGNIDFISDRCARTIPPSTCPYLLSHGDFFYPLIVHSNMHCCQTLPCVWSCRTLHLMPSRSCGQTALSFLFREF